MIGPCKLCYFLSIRHLKVVKNDNRLVLVLPLPLGKQLLKVKLDYNHRLSPVAYARVPSCSAKIMNESTWYDTAITGHSVNDIQNIVCTIIVMCTIVIMRCIFDYIQLAVQILTLWYNWYDASSHPAGSESVLQPSSYRSSPYSCHTTPASDTHLLTDRHPGERCLSTGSPTSTGSAAAGTATGTAGTTS